MNLSSHDSRRTKKYHKATIISFALKSASKTEISNERFSPFLCSLGGFFQNAVGHFGKIAGLTGCKYCARGTYVNVSRAPALIRFTCKVCPAGRRILMKNVYMIE